MKKSLLFLAGLSSVMLSGCVYEIYPGAPVAGLPTEDPGSPQPKYKSEQERYESYALDQAVHKAVLDIKHKKPYLFKDHRKFAVNTFANASDPNKTELIGRVLGTSMVKAVGKTATSRQVRLNNNSAISIHNGYVTSLSPEAIELAKRFDTTALFTGTYYVNQGMVNVYISVINLNTNQPLVEHSFAVPLDHKLIEITNRK